MPIFEQISSLLRRHKHADKTDGVESAKVFAAKQLIEEGNKLEDAWRLQEALNKYELALNTAPGYAGAHLNRGNILLKVSQPLLAAQAYQDAITSEPGLAPAHFNLGNALAELNMLTGALEAYVEATRLKPEFIDAWIARGNLLGDLGQHESALESYSRALRLAPDYSQIHRNVGLTLRQVGRLDDARSSFETAFRLQPDSVDVCCDLSNVSRELGDVDGAIKTARLASNMQPFSAGAHSLLLFSLSHSGDISAADLYQEHCLFGEKFELGQDYSQIAHKNTRNSGRVIKLGIVSADLRNHAVASFFEPMFYLLQQAKDLCLFVYDNGGPSDEVSKRLKASSSHWVEVAAMTDEVLADMIRHDSIDVLIDLSGHTAGHRLLTFARKPAPIQISWIGYPGTTGMRSMDYFVADPHYLPPGKFDACFTEKIIRLPATTPFQSVDNPPDVNPLPALTTGHICFGSFNRLDKISEQVVTHWAALLLAVPNSRMLVGGMPLSGNLDQITGWFANAGIHADRLTFFRRSSMYDYLKLHHQVDVCLDTFPYGGGTTTCHALYMGVPTLTVVGHTPAAASCAAILSHVGVERQFVAIDSGDFVRKGQWCANHLQDLAAIRTSLRQRFQASNMMQPMVVTDGLVHAIRFAWKRWCQDLPTVSFEVTHINGQFEVALQ